MKRRTFLKRSSIGLSALVAGVAGLRGAPRTGPAAGRVYGVPESVKPRTPLEDNLLRLSLSRTDVPPEAWQDVAALSLLAQDVFDNPEVARSFSRDPAAYLKAVGLDDVKLDPGAAEVKVALALGDPDVRAAIERDDPRAFVQALETRGLIQSPEPSQLAQRIGAQLESLKSELGDRFTPEACSVFAICIAAVWIWVAVVQDAVVAVAAVVIAAGGWASSWRTSPPSDWPERWAVPSSAIGWPTPSWRRTSSESPPRSSRWRHTAGPGLFRPIGCAIWCAGRCCAS